MAAVGLSLGRIDGAEKVAGQAVYAGDLRLPGMAHAKVLRSSVPHARIRRIDATKAGALPGVLGVLTRDNLNLATNSFGAYVRDQQILASEKVRYVGDMVAAVAATAPGVAAPALANAVFAAVGKRVQVVPLTPGLVWQAMRQKS